MLSTELINKKKYLFILTVHGLILCSLLFVSIPRTEAQDFEVSPVLIRFNANPGEIQSRSVHITNHSNKMETFTFNLADYMLDEDGKKQSAPAGSTARSCANWITVNPSFLALNPNEGADVEVLMTVPSDGFQSKWGMIQVQPAREQTSRSADKNLGAGVIIVPRIVILVQQSPETNTNYKGTIRDIREIAEAARKTRSFEATVDNLGDKVLEAKVTLAVANIQTADEQSFPPKTLTIYPDHSRKVVLELDRDLAPGQYAVAAMLDYGHRQPIEITQMLLSVE